MNPVSAATYYRRHVRSAVLQISLIGLATVGLFVLVGVLDAIPQRANVHYLTRLSRVTPSGGVLDPAVVSQIQSHPDIARVIPDNGLSITLPSLLGTDGQRLMGVSTEDAQALMAHSDLRLKAGRLFEPHSNEFVLSEEVARALDLELGSEIGREIDEDRYWAISTPLVLVGILEGAPPGSGPSVRLGFVSARYLNDHERYAPRVTSLLVIAREGQKLAVDGWLETAIASKYTEIETFAQLAGFLQVARVAVYAIFGVVNSVVAIAVAMVVGVINRITITKRLSELGLLHALGRTRQHLARRLTLETAIVSGLGFLLGLGAAVAVMWWIKSSIFYDLGMELVLLNPAPLCFVLPIPLIVVALTFLNVRRVFRRLDAVAVVERGKLSQEASNRQAAPRSGAPHSSNRPLSSLTFYLRHRRRGALIVLSTAVMLLGVTLPVFLLTAMVSAMMPYKAYLEDVSIVAPAQTELDPGIVGQIRNHPGVAHAIWTIRLSMYMVLPPGGGTDVPVLGVSEADLPLLAERLGVHVQKGRLPRPRSNEIALSAAIAANRSLRVGDIVGGETREDDSLIVDSLPTEMVIVGVLSPDRPWIGFASYEFLTSHELTLSRRPLLLVIPQEGYKQTLDRWLQDSIDPALAQVTTYEDQAREDRESTTSIGLTFALLECMVAVVAAVSLAALNHIFFDQRREEFGILNAVGHGRRWLVWRAIKETGSAVGVSWIIGAALCGIGLLVMQGVFYGPRGLTLNFFSPAPWLLTLPIPLAVVMASAGTIAWSLFRLDPVAVIEQR